MRRTTNDLIGASAAAFAAVCLWANCAVAHAAEKATPGKTGATKTSTTPAPQTPAPIAAPFTNKFLSVFSTDAPRDPFNPQSRPKSASQPVLTGPQSELEQPALLAAIQNGFQGIFGGAEERLLMVHGVLMPENRETTIVVPVGNQKRRLKVKAVKIYRNAAELQVEGLSQIVAVPRAQR
jgi:hypothetical protein